MAKDIENRRRAGFLTSALHREAPLNCIREGFLCAAEFDETCNQQLEECGFPFTFPGAYCEDESDGCGDPGGGPGEADDGDTLSSCVCATSFNCP